MTLNKPRLLIILNDAPFFISHRLPIAIAARDTGYEVHIATPFDKQSVTIMLSNGLFHHHIPLRRGTRNPFLEIWLILTLLRLIHLTKPQLLHCVTMKPVLYAGIIFPLLYGRTVPEKRIQCFTFTAGHSVHSCYNYGCLPCRCQSVAFI